MSKENTGNLWISETFVNETKGGIFGESEPYETFTDDISRLYKSLRRDYGGNVKKQYCDFKDGTSKQTGWVFSKRMKYEDALGNDPERDYYTRTVWVTVYKSEPVKHVTWDIQHFDF